MIAQTDFDINYSFKRPLPSSETPIVEIDAEIKVSVELSVIREGKVIQTVYTTALEQKEV